MYIFDLDGTIALNEHRQHYLPKEGKKDWVAWNKACVDDTIHHGVVEIMHALSMAGQKCHIITGRSAVVRKQTVLWLKKHNIPFGTLMMRPGMDHRDDCIIKLEMLRAVESMYPGDKVIAIFEDRQKVVNMWRKEGYTCLQVAPGDF